MNGWRSESAMRPKLWKPGLLALGFAASTATAAGQAATAQPANAAEGGPRVLWSAPTAPFTVVPQPGQVLRVLEDPNLGDRWLLVRNEACPAGPARLVLDSTVQRARSGLLPGVAGGGSRPSSAPLIRAGDRVVVEEHTAMVEARLDAVALGPAWTGSELNVRLTLGGRVVRAVALAGGHAALQPGTAARP